MVVVLVEDKTETLVILVDQVEVELVEDLHQEVLVDLQLKHHLVVEQGMVLLVVMGKRDLPLEEEVEEVPDSQVVLAQINLEMDLVDMEYKHHHPLEILQVQLVIQELMVVEVLQLLVVIGLLAVVVLAHLHITQLMELVALVVEVLDLVVVL
jgi:hypothetical protein